MAEKAKCLHIHPDGSEALHFHQDNSNIMRPRWYYKCDICEKEFAYIPDITQNITNEYQNEKYSIGDKEEYTIKELCRIFLISESNLKWLIKNGYLNAYMKKGYCCRKCNYITKKELQRFLSVPSNSRLKKMYDVYLKVEKLEDEVAELRCKIKALHEERIDTCKVINK